MRRTRLPKSAVEAWTSRSALQTAGQTERNTRCVTSLCLAM
jgi:hypothetical protein